jgi:hypothetical protein
MYKNKLLLQNRVITTIDSSEDGIEDQNYLSVLPSVKKKISIAKIRTNSHELHSKTGRWTIPKTPWASL